ncbi:MAG TPA: multidrug transporter [Sphingobium sp.]|uniref:SapC family protein n=1 Tax=unclassified Sphingobium TaxID=2611147 RepID=UPI000EBB1738|nr:MULTISPECIES: SapC family protein [unclassified Sphingobium]WIW89864.1 SapC family protein [Sphingobium sp. V4]HAF40580.1 multidrug transporter [Sphingobium sp.]
MASAPANNLPIFYNDLLPLSTVDHADFKSRSVESAPFLTTQHAVPLTVDEFVNAQRFAPIIFSAGADSVPLLLMGLNEGVNIFVDDEGKLRGPAYVPAYVRRYPWMLAKLRPDSEELSLCFDPTSPAIGAFEEGNALFEDGKPSELTQGVLKFCEDFEQAAARTGQFVRELQELGLLMDGEVSIQTPIADQPFVYRGFRMINEEKLRDLRGDQLRKINQSGMLPLIHAHLFSLQLMREIFEAQIAQGKGPIAMPETPVPVEA